MKKTSYSLLFILFGLLISCSQGKKKAEAIRQMEDQLIDAKSGTYDKTKASALILAYQDYIGEHPKDTLSASYLFKTAELQLNTTTPAQSIATLDRLIQDFPEYRRTPEALFLKGFIYENYLKDLNNARKYYQDFLGKYPTHHFADDARALLDNLGKSPEELIREFEKKNQEKATGE